MREFRMGIIVGLVAMLSLPLIATPVAQASCCIFDGGIKTIAPTRLVDTRAGASTGDGRQAGAGAIEAGVTLVIEVAGRGGIPDDAGAVVLNVTAVRPTATAYITVWPAGSPRPSTSNLNTAPDRTLPNLVIVPLGDDGNVAVQVSAGSTHLVVDATAWFPKQGDFTGIQPTRFVDTRPTGVTFDGAEQRHEGPVGPESGLSPVIAGRGGVPATAGSVVLNVTAVNPTAKGYITVWPAGEPRPTTSNLNLAPGRTLPNLVVVPVGAEGRVSIYNATGEVQIVVDVLGWFRSDGGFTGLVPARLADTRAGTTTVDGLQHDLGRVHSAGSLVVQVAGRGGVPGDAAAVVLNVTAVNPTARGYITVWSGDGSLVPPNVSSLNTDVGRTLPNAVLVPLSSNGTVALWNYGGDVDVIVDVMGWFAADETAFMMSKPAGGAPAGESSEPSPSRDARFVAFVSADPTLVANDVDQQLDVFVRDTMTNTIEMVSIGGNGRQSMSDDWLAAITPDGRYVAIVNDESVYVRDRDTDTTEQVTNSDVGGIYSDVSISTDGRFVAYTSLLNVSNVFVRDRLLQQTILVSVNLDGQPGQFSSDAPSITADGRYVAFSSADSNLVTGDSNERDDVFVRDLVAGTTVLASVNSDGSQADANSSYPRISADGRIVVFEADAPFADDPDANDTTVDVYAHNLVTGQTTMVSASRSYPASYDHSYDASISADGRYVAFVSRASNVVTDDTNGTSDVFVRDLLLSSTVRVSLTAADLESSGWSREPEISPDGRFVVFVSDATDVTATSNGQPSVYLRRVPIGS